MQLHATALATVASLQAETILLGVENSFAISHASFIRAKLRPLAAAQEPVVPVCSAAGILSAESEHADSDPTTDSTDAALPKRQL